MLGKICKDLTTYTDQYVLVKMLAFVRRESIVVPEAILRSMEPIMDYIYIRFYWEPLLVWIIQLLHGSVEAFLKPALDDMVALVRINRRGARRELRPKKEEYLLLLLYHTPLTLTPQIPLRKS